MANKMLRVIGVTVVAVAVVFGGAHPALAEQAQCTPSPVREFGPFYKPGAPYKSTICEWDERVQLGFVRATTSYSRVHHPGQYRLRVRGTVRSSEGCAPLPGVELDVYQAHQFGKYGDLSPSQEDGFCRGVVTTGPGGEYEFETYFPGSYGVLAGLLPFEGLDLPPYVDRHIHLVVWGEGHEVLPTQLLMGDDPLLHSGIRGVAHGYNGTGLVLLPVLNKTAGVWEASGVDFVLKKGGETRPSREEAARDFCGQSVGDMIVPALCMPHVASIVAPSVIYLVLLPGTLYVVFPAVLMVLAHLITRSMPEGVRWLVYATAIPVAIGVFVHIIQPESPDRCLAVFEMDRGAHLLRLKGGKGHLEYHRFGSRAPNATKVILQHGTGREGGVFGMYDDFFASHNIEVLAPTLPGYACSSPQPGRDVGRWGEVVEQLVDAVGWGDSTFYVAGYSFGGAHALSVLAALPSRVRGVLVVSPTLPPEHAHSVSSQRDKGVGLAVRLLGLTGETFVGRGVVALSAGVLGVQGMIPNVVHEAMDSLSAAGLASTADNLRSSWARAVSRGTGGVAENIAVRERAWNVPLETLPSVPITILGNPHDTIDPPEIATFLSETIPTARLAWKDSVHGHWHYWAHFEDELSTFLSSQP